MRILITGGAGFIGSNLVHHLNRERPDDEVVVLDDLSTGYRANLDDARCRLIQGSITDADLVLDAMRDVDAVVHLAAIPSVPRSVLDPRRSHDANITGTLVVLEAARERGVPYLVTASSSSVYGSNPAMPKRETDWTAPMSPYAVTKLAAEAYTIAYQHSYDMATLAFRFFNVYGPRQAADHAYAAVVPRFIDRALAGRPLPVEGDGGQSRDFTHVDSVCAAITRAVTERVVSPRPVNLAFGTRTTLAELIATIERAVGRPAEIEHLEPRVGDVRASQADGSVLRALMPGLASVPFDEGVRSTVAWFEAQAAARIDPPVRAEPPSR